MSKHHSLGGGYLLGAKSGIRPIILASSASLTLLLSLMLFPTLPDSVSAEETTSKLSLAISPTLSLSLQDTVNLNVTPTQNGTFSSSTATLSISTNNETGYSLYMATSNGKNTLASQNPNTTDAISAISSDENGIPSADFPSNTWGYSLDEAAPTNTTTYQAVPTDNTTALTTTSTASNDSYNLTFGAKVDTSLPSGTYSNQVIISAVANPAYVPTLSQIDNMQDMTPEICQASSENETKQLTDTRDGKKYWVTKLADNNCWMTQNLDLDLSASKPLTPDNSDVSSSWTPTVSTTATIFNSSSNTGQYSWDPGMYVKSNPNGYAYFCSSVSSLSNSSCTSAGWTDVSNMTPMSDGATNTAISGNTYNAHYLVGNYYQWNAATAGTGGSITSTNATDSICPKGWQLPTSNNSNSGSFQYLMNAYSIDNDSTKITQSPLYFHPSGDVASGSLGYAGNRGLYWSSTAYSSSSNAYSPYFFSGYVQSSGNYPRYFGQSLRCLAHQ